MQVLRIGDEAYESAGKLFTLASATPFMQLHTS